VRDKSFRINLPFEEAVRRALDTKPISNEDLKTWVKSERRKPAKARMKRPARRAAHR
jgi:hypothetical protein